MVRRLLGRDGTSVVEESEDRLDEPKVFGTGHLVPNGSYDPDTSAFLVRETKRVGRDPNVLLRILLCKRIGSST